MFSFRKTSDDHSRFLSMKVIFILAATMAVTLMACSTGEPKGKTYQKTGSVSPERSSNQEQTKSDEGDQTPKTSSETSSPPTKDPLKGSGSKYSNIVVPDQVCGREGFKFLMDHYFKEECSVCHNETGLAPLKFTVADFETSFGTAVEIKDATLIKTTTQNAYCTGCNLVDGDNMLAAIKKWQLNKRACP